MGEPPCLAHLLDANSRVPDFAADDERDEPIMSEGEAGASDAAPAAEHSCQQ